MDACLIVGNFSLTLTFFYFKNFMHKNVYGNGQEYNLLETNVNSKR